MQLTGIMCTLAVVLHPILQLHWQMHLPGVDNGAAAFADHLQHRETEAMREQHQPARIAQHLVQVQRTMWFGAVPPCRCQAMHCCDFLATQ